MSLAKSYSAQLIGLSPEIITVEVDITNGLHSLSIVGLGDRSVDEAKDRVSAAIKNSGFTSPKQRNQKVVVSLAPADIRKEGPSFDLAIAITYLSASNSIHFDAKNILLFGELSLEGNLRKVSGLLPILCKAKSLGFETVFIPRDNSNEASLAQGINIFCFSSLREVVDHINGDSYVMSLPSNNNIAGSQVIDDAPDMNQIRGNESAKRGLEIAAAGSHNVIMSGPPGTGKTMLAASFRSILPDLSYEESVEITGIYSAAKQLGQALITRPPFRSPHHTASYPSIVGGGSFPKPGEITLSHKGVLFLDEFPEFDRSVIESLRQPLEERIITISRSKGTITFPAHCILIASMNPCPCGKGRDKGCTCSFKAIESYKRKISGPIMDRLDVWLQINKIDYEKLAAKNHSSESSEQIKARVRSARNIQKERFAKFNINKSFNSEMSAGDIEKCVELDQKARRLLTESAQKLEMSARSFHRIIKVSQTIADLQSEKIILEKHILEALQYRQKLAN